MTLSIRFFHLVSSYYSLEANRSGTFIFTVHLNSFVVLVVQCLGLGPYPLPPGMVYPRRPYRLWWVLTLNLNRTTTKILIINTVDGGERDLFLSPFCMSSTERLHRTSEVVRSSTIEV